MRFDDFLLKILFTFVFVLFPSWFSLRLKCLCFIISSRKRRIPIMTNEAFKHSIIRPYHESLGLAVYNCGFQRCGPGHSWGPATVSYTHLDVYKRQIYAFSIIFLFPLPNCPLYSRTSRNGNQLFLFCGKISLSLFFG